MPVQHFGFHLYLIWSYMCACSFVCGRLTSSYKTLERDFYLSLQSEILSMMAVALKKFLKLVLTDEGVL